MENTIPVEGLDSVLYISFTIENKYCFQKIFWQSSAARNDALDTKCS